MPAPATVTLQVLPLAEVHPAHRSKKYPASGMAVRVTRLVSANRPLHEVPQVMPAGTLFTVPIPLPSLVTAMA